MTAADEQWEHVAVASRQALALLGYDIGPRCLPGEDAQCGGTFAQHAAAHLATLSAVADHQLMHTGMPKQMIREIYDNTAAELHAGCS